MRYEHKPKLCISFKNAFHGRTLGALSLTNTTKKQQKESFLSIPTERLPYTEEAGNVLLNLLNTYSPTDIACVIMEPIQGEGGYNIPPEKMVQDIRAITKEHNIPLISDEVQAGMGRTGEWWGIEQYGVIPDAMSVGKALQVGATVANKSLFPEEPGSISSTWGGGHRLDLALGIQVIKTIKKKHMLNKVNKQGKYLLRRLHELSTEGKVMHPRGKGLMTAIDLPSNKMRNDVVMEAAKNGLVLLGCGLTGIRCIPPYIVTPKEIDEAMAILSQAIKVCSQRNFTHKGNICTFADCSQTHT
jgi:4-aminobutyrate aminotransferase